MLDPIPILQALLTAPDFATGQQAALDIMIQQVQDSDAQLSEDDPQNDNLRNVVQDLLGELQTGRAARTPPSKT